MVQSNNRASWLATGIMFSLLMIAIVGAMIILLTREIPSTTVQIMPPLPTHTATATVTPAPLEIYVVGAVQTPEARISVPPGSRVEDALDMVGLQENADLAQVNMAQRLQDGDMIFVPAQADTFIGETVGQDIQTPTPNTPRQININTATLEELDTLPGIGPSKAQSIIDYREANGAFNSVDEIVNVRGIGEGTLEDLRPYLAVE